VRAGVGRCAQACELAKTAVRARLLSEGERGPCKMSDDELGPHNLATSRPTPAPSLMGLLGATARLAHELKKIPLYAHGEGEVTIDT